MSNWTGTYAITTPGTTLTSATSTVATNTGASWPASNQLANQRIRFTSGVNSGHDVVILSNTTTTLTVASWPVGTPSAGDAYKLILQFQNSDHITAAVTLSTNINCEIADNATLLVDGNFTITVQTSCTFNWTKTETTFATAQLNNRTVSGVQSAWGGISFASTLTVNPKIQYVQLFDAAAILVTPSASITDYSGINHVWMEGQSSAESVALITAALSCDFILSNILVRYGRSAAVLMSGVNSTFKMVVDTLWMEKLAQGGVTFGAAHAGPALQWVRNSVFRGAQRLTPADTSASIEHRVSDCESEGSSGTIGLAQAMLAQSTTADAGKHTAFANIWRNGAIIQSTGSAGSTGTTTSSSNDVKADAYALVAGMVCPAGSGTTITSDNDLFQGNATACSANIDTTASTTSTATPVQYSILTAARTHPRSTPNFPLVCDNVVVGTPGANSVTITYDSQNGAAASQQTTVNVDSASGQPVLSVASTTGLVVGQLMEVAYGTARAEAPARILSISAGVSITLDANLAFAHTAAQADVVSMQLRRPAIAFVRYGTSSGVYTMQTALPDPQDFGIIRTGMRTSANGKPYAFKKTGHSVTLTNLQPATKYYFEGCGATSTGGDVIVSAESSFTTAAASSSGTVAYGHAA